MFDRSIRPEWIDFALEQYLRSDSEAQLRESLRNFLRPLVNDPQTLQKTALQLQRTVGFRSRLSHQSLEGYYDQLSSMQPDKRNPVRLEILCRSNEFFADCVRVLRKLKASGTEFAELRHLYERLVVIYGDRGMVHRRVRYVIQTLASFGSVTHCGRTWRVEESLLDVNC